MTHKALEVSHVLGCQNVDDEHCQLLKGLKYDPLNANMLLAGMESAMDPGLQPSHTVINFIKMHITCSHKRAHTQAYVYDRQLHHMYKL